MTTVTDMQSTARMVITLALLIPLGAWYLARGDHLKHALSARFFAALRRPGRPRRSSPDVDAG